MTLIPAFKKGIELADQIRAAKKKGNENSLDIWWLGQSGFLIQWNKLCVLFDPYLSDSLTKKYAATDKPHVRMSELVIDPHLLDFIDIVTSSHNHTDHLDAETLIPILKQNPKIKFLIPEANRAFVANRAQCPLEFPTGLTDGQSKEIAGVRFHGVASAHNTIDRDEKGNCIFVGYVAEFGKFKIYHSGDTLLYDGLAETLKHFRCDVAFLPINGNLPERRVAGNLNAAEAAWLGKEINTKCVAPHHYHLFEFNTAKPKDFENECKKIGTPFKVLKLGERFTIS